MDDKTTASITEFDSHKDARELLDLSAPLMLPPSVVGKRVTESYNPNDVYVCPNGHLAYNLTTEAIQDCRHRNVVPPPVVYEGGRCSQCSEPYNRLENDPQTLQFRVSNFMKMAARLKAQEEGLLKINADYNTIALFMRGVYAWEIEQGEPQHSGTLSKCVVWYLQRERRRPSVVAGKLWRAFKRMLGAQ